MSDAPKKIPAKTITFTRAEGLPNECRPREFGNWQSVNRHLWQISSTAPQDGSVDKCDFTIEFADGNLYQGRFELQHYSVAGDRLNLVGHVRGHLEFVSGRAKHPACGAENYQRILATYPQAMREEAGRFLDTYEIELT